MKKVYIILLLIIHYGRFLAQAQDQKIIPVSPEAASIAKYVNFPINYATGMPNISIPLFEIKSGDILIPVTLNYHSGGIRTNEKAGWVGMGWSLSSDIGITRINHQTTNGQNNYVPPNSGVPLNDQYNWLDGKISGQPDDYYYNIPGKSGRFTLAGTGLMQAPYDPLVNINGTSSISYNGINYAFNGVNEISHCVFPLEDQISAYKCTDITSAKGDAIHISYNTVIGKTYSIPNNRIEVCDSSTYYFPDGPVTDYNFSGYNWMDVGLAIDAYNPGMPLWNVHKPRVYVYSSNPGESGLYLASNQLDGNGQYHAVFEKQDNYPALSPSYTTSYVEHKKINEITYDGGKVKFFLKVIGGIQYNVLDSIVSYDPTGKVIKVIRFDNDGRTDDKFQLNGFSIGSSNGHVENYSFEYLPESSIANGKTQIIHFLDRAYTGSSPQKMSFNGVIGDSYDPEWTNQNYYNPPLVTKIQYPGKGYTTFEYESNEYLNMSTNIIQSALGMRIKSVKHFDGTNLTAAFEKDYKYGEAEDGTGIKLYNDDPSHYSYEQTAYHCSPSMWFPDMFGPPNLRILPLITERKRTYFALPIDQAIVSTGAPVAYTSVTEYQQDFGLQTGKTVYAYNPPNTNLTEWKWYTSVSFERPSWSGSELLSTTHYMYHNNQYQWIAKNETSYLNFTSPGYAISYKPFNFNVVDGVSYPSMSGQQEVPGYPIDIHNFFQQGFVSYNDILYGGCVLPQTETISTRDLNNPSLVLTTQKNYYYDNLSHLKPNRIEQINNSKGETITQYLSYWQDYASGNPGTVDNSPIENVTVMQDISGSKIISGQLTTYKNSSPSMIDKIYKLETNSPIAVSSFKFSNRALGYLPVPGTNLTSFAMDAHYREELAFNYENYGNPNKITSRNSISTSYQWGYNHKYPVAECKNASNTEFYYEGFEESTAGGVMSSTGHTGNRYTTSTAVSWTLPNSRSYVISYWYLSGGTWQYSGEQLFTGSFVMTGGNGYDDIRIYPTDAQMTTYTYDQMVGMTSMIDAKGQTTYYEYDEFQRLKNVKDQNGHILKQTDYHYKN